MTVEEMLLEMGADVTRSPYTGSWSATMADTKRPSHLYAYGDTPNEALVALREKWVLAGSPPPVIYEEHEVTALREWVEQRDNWREIGQQTDGSPEVQLPDWRPS